MRVICEFIIVHVNLIIMQHTSLLWLHRCIRLLLRVNRHVGNTVYFKCKYSFNVSNRQKIPSSNLTDYSIYINIVILFGQKEGNLKT